MRNVFSRLVEVLHGESKWQHRQKVQTIPGTVLHSLGKQWQAWLVLGRYPVWISDGAPAILY